LDAGTKENQFLATSEKLVFSKWRSGSDSPCLPKLTWRFGLERLFLTGLRCTLKRSLLSETPATFSLRVLTSSSLLHPTRLSMICANPPGIVIPDKAAGLETCSDFRTRIKTDIRPSEKI